LLRRGPDGQIVNDPANPGVITSFINGVETSADGIQLSADYNIPLNTAANGKIFLSVNGLWLNRRLPNITGVAPQRTDTLTGDPEFSGQFNLSYDDDRGGIFTSVNWESATFSSLTATVENSQFIKYREEYRVNGGIYAKFGERSRFTIAVTNLFDSNGGFPRNLDPLGRRFTAAINHRF